MEKNQALIFDIKHFAVHDGPGIRTTFFIKGCPLRCLWCQNPESFEVAQRLCFDRHKCIGCGECRKVCDKIDQNYLIKREDCTLCGRCITACKPGARKQEAQLMSADEIVKKALREKVYFEISGGGVTFSGGECMSRPDFLREALKGVKEAGIHTVVDTCGHVPRENFDMVLPYTDLFLYDIKKIDTQAHRELTGCGSELILENLEHICALGAKVIARVPLIPGYTDSREDMERIADFIERKLENRIERIELLPYNKLAESKYYNNTAYSDERFEKKYPLGELTAQTNEYVDTLCGIFGDRGIPCFAEKL